VDPDPDPRKEIEVDPDPDLDPERGLKWIRIRPNAVDPGGSGSGSETLLWIILNHLSPLKLLIHRSVRIHMFSTSLLYQCTVILFVFLCTVAQHQFSKCLCVVTSKSKCMNCTIGHGQNWVQLYTSGYDCAVAGTAVHTYWQKLCSQNRLTLWPIYVT